MLTPRFASPPTGLGTPHTDQDMSWVPRVEVYKLMKFPRPPPPCYLGVVPLCHQINESPAA